MKVLSKEIAAAAALAPLGELERTVGMPNGKSYLFGQDGLAEVDDDCGADLVPVFQIMEGTPAAFMVGTEVRSPDGDMVEIFAAAEMAGEEVACGDGHTVVRFSAYGGRSRGFGPSTCLLDQVPGYQFGRLVKDTPDVAVEPGPCEPNPPLPSQAKDAVIADLKAQIGALTARLEALEAAPEPEVMIATETFSEDPAVEDAVASMAAFPTIAAAPEPEPAKQEAAPKPVARTQASKATEARRKALEAARAAKARRA